MASFSVAVCGALVDQVEPVQLHDRSCFSFRHNASSHRRFRSDHMVVPLRCPSKTERGGADFLVIILPTYLDALHQRATADCCRGQNKQHGLFFACVFESTIIVRCTHAPLYFQTSATYTKHRTWRLGSLRPYVRACERTHVCKQPNPSLPLPVRAFAFSVGEEMIVRLWACLPCTLEYNGSALLKAKQTKWTDPAYSSRFACLHHNATTRLLTCLQHM